MLSRSRKAFTLLELIVVIVILGILAALAIPTFKNVIDRSKRANAETSALSIGRSAIALASFDAEGGVVDVNVDVDGTGLGTDTYLDLAIGEVTGAAAGAEVDEVVVAGYTVTLEFAGNTVDVLSAVAN